MPYSADRSKEKSPITSLWPEGSRIELKFFEGVSFSNLSAPLHEIFNYISTRVLLHAPCFALGGTRGVIKGVMDYVEVDLLENDTLC